MLGNQAAAQYAADGAGQAALTRLRQGTFPNLCQAKNGDTLSLGTAAAPFYPAGGSNTTAYNASITCTPDTATGSGGTIGSGNKPNQAILTVGTSAADQFAQSYGKKTVPVANGDVISDSTITGSTTSCSLRHIQSRPLPATRPLRALAFPHLEYPFRRTAPRLHR